ncbi:MAG: hypothetical protein KJO12_06505 [Ignavibacteria bacterium]|nr:hypothetical protein [Ignavibacteria bacterium]
MNAAINISVILFFSTIMGYAQSKPYWDNAPITGIKIYSVEFIDNDNGWAKSKLGEILITTDGGIHWIVDSSRFELTNIEKHLWSTEIYCSVMNTTDGGITWSQYTDEMQDHFCQVYFKNENTGWKTSEEFLHKVVSTIKSFLDKKDLKSLYSKAIQCSEYYTDMNSGWALGWCVKNYKSN